MSKSKSAAKPKIVIKEHRAPKEEVINVRCTLRQKDELEKVAAREGLGLSTWLLHVGLLAAQGRQTREEPR